MILILLTQVGLSGGIGLEIWVLSSYGFGGPPGAMSGDCYIFMVINLCAFGGCAFIYLFSYFLVLYNWVLFFVFMASALSCIDKCLSLDELNTL